MPSVIYRWMLWLVPGLLFACQASNPAPSEPAMLPAQGPSLVVLGIAQDAGYPQVNCRKNCCRQVTEQGGEPVACLALIDPDQQRYWLFDATPDFREQVAAVHQLFGSNGPPTLAGIFLTHAHIGHYTGLMQLGREVMGAREVPVYAMPRMQDFLRHNGPWDQLVNLENIRLMPLHADSAIQLAPDIRVTPLPVPHRDEYSETVGFRIQGAQRSALFIPDIDKWAQWERQVANEVALVDVAFLDGTFFADDELPGRNMAEIPHPFVAESMAHMASWPASERAKVHFIHFNHTNPLLQPDSEASRTLEAAGLARATTHQVVPL
ncbi:MAG: MBL fold metallo-hydrolase [Bacteroidota bacterium]